MTTQHSSALKETKHIILPHFCEDECAKRLFHHLGESEPFSLRVCNSQTTGNLLPDLLVLDQLH